MAKEKKTTKTWQDFPNIVKGVAIIKELANFFNYTVDIYTFQHYKTNRLAVAVELLGSSDSEGNPYSWAWYLDTGELV